MITRTELVLSLGYLIGQILNGDMDDPRTLAATLQGYADQAWDECDKVIETTIHPQQQ
ncbi:hypothetical protein NIES4103_68700 (plasmid) [Nostoc sp. NIES-4103]|nr:hypothetical protein NIES4103_68700 [Nostoc sp. NIES-4103]